MIFVYAMLILSATGAAIVGLNALRAHRQLNVATAMQGVLTFYLVITALLTVRRRVVGFRGIDLVAMLVPLTITAAYVRFGWEASQSATGTKYGYPPPLYVVFGTVALLAASGDVRMMLAGGLQGVHRIARHLWRMCFAMFIATGSFFLGQAKVIPKPIRIMPLLSILALLPLVIILYWLARVLLSQWHARTERAIQISREAHAG